MQRAMPCGDTMMPFCDGEYLPRTMGRMLLFINYDYACPGEMSKRHEMLHAQLLIPGVERYRYPPHTDI